MSYVIDAKSEKIAGRMGVTNKQGLATFDPAVIMAILSAVGATIVQVIQAIANCNNPAPPPAQEEGPTNGSKAKKPVRALTALAGQSPMAVINNPGLFHKMRLGVMCRTELIRAGVPMKYQYLAKEMKQAMIDEGQETSQEEFNQLLLETTQINNNTDPWSF